MLKKIHAHAFKGVFMITGGGSQLISSLLKVPGASNTVLQALVPYSGQSLKEQLGFVPQQACSEETARFMAMRSFQIALAEKGRASADKLFGFAITASLASKPAKRGQHRIHIAAQTFSSTYSWSLVLDKQQRSRAQEEKLCRNLALNALCEIMQLKPAKNLKLSRTETVLSHSVNADTDLQCLLFSENQTSKLTRSGISSRPELIFPGAFNPLHRGHEKMMTLASQLTGLTGWYEISVHNVDKPALDFLSIERRCEAFQDQSINLILSTAAKFEEKARCFPGAIFIVGIDTLERIADTRYYNDSVKKRDAALSEISNMSCRFLVFGRVDNNNQGKSDHFKRMSDIQLPSQLKAICSEIPESAYREDISSSEIRKLDQG